MLAWTWQPSRCGWVTRASNPPTSTFTPTWRSKNGRLRALLRPACGPVATTPLTSYSPSWNASDYVADSPSLPSLRIGLQKGPRHNSGRYISGEHAEPELTRECRLADQQQGERALRIHLSVGQQPQLLELVGCQQVGLINDE